MLPTDTTAPSQGGYHFRLDLLLTSDLAAHIKPPVTTTKKQPRLTRYTKVRAQPRQQAPQPRPAPAQPAPDYDFTAAATNDSRLEALSPTARRMQMQARTRAYEHYRQRSDRESLRRLQAATKAYQVKAARLDRISRAVLERASKHQRYTPRTISTSELEDFAALDSTSDSDLHYSDTDSFVFVDSQPTLESEDVFGIEPRYVAASPQIHFVMPTLSYGQESADNTLSSGRPLKRIGEESTGSFHGSLPHSMTSNRRTGSEGLSKDSIQARLQELGVDERQDVVSKSWLEEQIAEAMGNAIREDSTLDRNEQESDILPNQSPSWSGAPKLVERDEGTGHDHGYDVDTESEASYILINDEHDEKYMESVNEEEEVQQDEENDWFEVVTQSMVNSRM